MVHFVSPDFSDIVNASLRPKSRQHGRALDFYRRVESAFGHSATVQEVVGYWQKIEVSTSTEDRRADLQTLRAKAALKALYSAQLSTVVFAYDHPPCRGMMYELTFSAKTPAQVSRLLSNAGFDAWTMKIKDKPRGTWKLLGRDGDRPAGSEHYEIDITLLDPDFSHPVNGRFFNYLDLIIDPGMESYVKNKQHHFGTIVFDGAETRQAAAEEFRRILDKSGITARPAEEREHLRRLRPWPKKRNQSEMLGKLREEAEANFKRLMSRQAPQRPISRMIERARNQRVVAAVRNRSWTSRRR